MIADKLYLSVNASGNTQHFDMKAAEEKEHFSPMESLLSSLAACAAVDLVQMIKKRRKALLGLEVVSEGKRKEEHPRAFTEITLTFRAFSPDLEEEEYKKLVELAAGKYCSVAGTLGVPIQHKIEILREAPVE